jgi:hypothetical protein
MPLTNCLPDEANGRLDRRQTRRYPIRQDVRFTLTVGNIVVAGAGTSLDIASSGMLFTTDHALTIGSFVELSMDWPCGLDDGCRLRFVASGRVVRSNGRQAAIRIKHHEFRTRSLRRQLQPIDADRIRANAVAG